MSETVSEIVRILGELRHKAEQLTVDSAHGAPLVRLGLMTTLYFKQGHTAETRHRLEACFTRFYETFRPFLKWQSYKNLRKLSPSGFASCRKLMLESHVEEPLLWSISSAEPTEAATHRMFVMGAGQSQNATDHSCLKMILPWTLLAEGDGAKTYEGWLRYLCDQLHSEHGYGGLACILPDDDARYLPLEYRFAQEHTGLMVDAGPHMESLYLLDRIKGVSWYTVLGSRFVQMLGGNDRLRRQLSVYSDIVFQGYDAGLLVRAGLLPELGEKGEAPSRAYTALHKALSAIRVRNTGCLHPYPIRGRGFTERSTVQWYARYDEKPKPPVSAGQPCPQAGYWFSNAKARSRRFFSKGEIMPAFEHVKAERTQWFWSQDPD